MLREFSRDPYNGTITYFDFDEGDKGNEVKFVTKQSRNHQADLLKSTAMRRNAGSDYGDKEMLHCASIPAIVQLEWLEKFGVLDITNPEYIPLIKKLLNSLDYCHLKTAQITL